MVTSKWETAEGKGSNSREATTPHDHTRTTTGREGEREGGKGCPRRGAKVGFVGRGLSGEDR